jgi:hypothetical protein
MKTYLPTSICSSLTDSTDPASIMYYELTANNATLDSTDSAGAQLLYGNGGVLPAPTADDIRVGNLVQGMATYDVADGVGSAIPPGSVASTELQLAATH